MKVNFINQKIMKNFLFISVIFLLMSCAANVYTSPDAHRFVARQKKIAILPPNITMQSGQFTGKFEQSKENETLQIQNAMFSWFLKRLGKSASFKEIQDVETTNNKLKKANYPDKDFTKAELCEILGVDAVIGSQYTLTKPMPQGVAIATSLLVGYEGTTNRIGATIHIFDNNAQKVIWNYGNEYSGTWRETYNDVVNQLMRNASKKLPYTK